MAKFTITLHPRPKKDGTCALMFSFTHKRFRKQIYLGLDLRPDQWDAENEKIVKHPHYRVLNQRVKLYSTAAEDVLLKFVGSNADGEKIFTEIELALFPEKATQKAEEEAAQKTIIEVFKRVAAMKKESTRLTYERTLKHIEAFIKTGHSNNFDEVSKSWLSAFDSYLSESNPSPNARALHFRNLRAVFNYAIDEELTANYPFRRFKIKTVKTAKRNLTVEELREVFNYGVEDWQVPYRDMFKLSFMLMGVNFADMLNLSKSDMRGGRIEFNRHKTSRLYSMKVEPEALELIQKYAGKEYLLSIMESRKDYVQYIRQTNHALKCIGTKSVKGRAPQGDALFPEITTYWARHTWATIARSIGVSVDDIALALGHGDGHDLTHIYIEEDLRKVDEANRKVLDWVLYGKKDGVIVDQAFKPKKETEKKKSGGTKKSTTPEIKAEEAA